VGFVLLDLVLFLFAIVLSVLRYTDSDCPFGIFKLFLWPNHFTGRRGRDRMVVGFATTCAISAYHHYICEFEPRSWRGVLDTTLCDKVCQWLATGRWFFLGTPVSSTNKTDRYDIAEILFVVALNIITLIGKRWVLGQLNWLNPAILIEVTAPGQESERTSTRVLVLSMLTLFLQHSIKCRLDFGIVPTVWYFSFFILS